MAKILIPFQKGPHTGYKRNAAGAIVAAGAITRTLTADSSASASDIIKVPGQGEQRFAVITNGWFAGLVVPVETPLARSRPSIFEPPGEPPPEDPPPDPDPEPPPPPPPSGVLVRPGLTPAQFAAALQAAINHPSRTLLLEQPGEYVVNDAIWGGGNGRIESGITIAALVPGCVLRGRVGDRFLYLGGNDWKLQGFALAGYRAPDSGMIGIVGAAARLTADGLTLIGTATDLNYDQNSHGFYFAGTGTGHLVIRTKIAKVLGSAVQFYRGSPGVTVRDSELQSLYVDSTQWSGKAVYDNVFFRYPTRVLLDAVDATLTGDCRTDGPVNYAGNVKGTMRRV